MPVTNNQQKTYWHMIGTSEMRSKMGQLKKYELSGFGILFFCWSDTQTSRQYQVSLKIKATSPLFFWSL